MYSIKIGTKHNLKSVPKEIPIKNEAPHFKQKYKPVKSNSLQKLIDVREYAIKLCDNEN